MIPPFFRDLPGTNDYVGLYKDLCTDIHESFINNISKLKTIQMSVPR